MKKFLTILLCAVLGLSLLPLGAAALEPVPGEIYAGIDVSEFQGNIDFQRVREAGIQAVYIRAGEGSDFTDPYFAANAQKAREAGLHYGFYLYVTARDPEQARVQAQFFAGLIAGKGHDCRPVMDFEAFDGLSNAQLNAIALAFLEELETQTGARPMLYTDAYAADNIWVEALGRYPLWAANWDVEEPDITSDIWSGWTGFQYADNGRIPGISGAVDLDRFTEGILLSDDEKPEPEPEPEPGETLRYTVQPGDTLWAIARRFGTTVSAIVEDNAIANPNLIYPGQVLLIHVSSQETHYTVQPGDTLWAIARRFGTTVSAIVDANAIADPNLIYPGQLLVIPRS